MAVASPTVGTSALVTASSIMARAWAASTCPVEACDARMYSATVCARTTWSNGAAMPASRGREKLWPSTGGPGQALEGETTRSECADPTLGHNCCRGRGARVAAGTWTKRGAPRTRALR
eukprot:5513296-Pyramimonas_sp.AAC.1